MRTGLPILLICAALAAPACSRTSEGVATVGTGAAPAATTTTTTSETDSPDPQTDMPAPGVMPSTTSAAPAGAPCVPATLPPVRVTAQISDPIAPTATVAVPEGWSMSTDPGGSRLDGPEGMWATVTIEATSNDPEDAFRIYADDLTAETVISTVSLLPGEMCDYSGQKLMGTLAWAGDTGDSVQYEARIVHVTAAGQGYLIAVYVEAPSGAPGFDEAASLMTADFEIGLP